MKPIARQQKKRPAFTIVELLTVMSIIVILIGLLVPALNRVRIFAREVKQKAQFHSMEAAIELFNNEFDGYPPSDMSPDPSGTVFACGATKLCEAMMGWDLLGFHRDSIFYTDGTGPDPANPGAYRTLYDATNLSSRKGPFLPLENASASLLSDIYGATTTPFNADNFVLCDVFTRKLQTNKKLGMPILYYKANPANALHLYDVQANMSMPPDRSDNAGNIYNYHDNHALVGLGKPWETGGNPHKLFETSGHPTQPDEAQGMRFYANTRNEAIVAPWRPYKAETYILISAGYDGEYGTADDLCNYEWNYFEMIPTP